MELQLLDEDVDQVRIEKKDGRVHPYYVSFRYWPKPFSSAYIFWGLSVGYSEEEIQVLFHSLRDASWDESFQANEWNFKKPELKLGNVVHPSERGKTWKVRFFMLRESDRSIYDRKFCKTKDFFKFPPFVVKRIVRLLNFVDRIDPEKRRLW